MQALSVVIKPQIRLLEHQGLVTLDDKLLIRAEIAFDELVNKVVDDTKRTSVNKTWMSLNSARNAKLNRVATASIFNTNLKIARSEVIGPWKWCRSYGGFIHSDFMHDIARVVLNLRCNTSATGQANNMYKHAIELERVH